MKINRKDGIYMADMFIFASIKKDEEKKVIDEDLTFSKEEDAIKDMITSMKSSDEKLWDKYNNGEEVDIYLYQLDKEHHPCLYKKVEVEKDGDSYKVDDEESYDLPEDFEAFIESVFDYGKIKNIENIYGLKIPSEIKSHLSSKVKFNNNGIRKLSINEIINANDELGYNFIDNKIIPLYDCGENNFIVYKNTDKSFALLNTNDKSIFKNTKNINEILKESSNFNDSVVKNEAGFGRHGFRDAGYTGFQKEKNLNDNKKQDSSSENYKKIKPETSISVDEAKKFWDDFFSKEIKEACELVDVFFDLYETGVITEDALNDELLILEEVVGRRSVNEAAARRKEETAKRRKWLKLHSKMSDGGYLTDEEREFVNSKPWSRAWEAEDDAKRHYHNTVCKYNEQRAAAKERLKKAQKEKKEKEKTMKYRTEPALESSMMSLITEMHNDDYICEEDYNKLSYITFAAKMISESYEENNRLMIDSIALLSESAENELNEIQSSVESLNLNNYLIESILLVNEYMTEKTLKAKDRNALDENEFGIPSLRKYPIHDKAHVKAAVQRFNFVDKAHEKELANNLIKVLKKFNMLNEIKVGKGNRFKTYLDAEFKTFSESFDLYPFPAVTKEFSIGAMLPMMGNTKGWGTELANTPITDVVAAGNADLEKYATLYDTTELINDSEVAMESVLPKRNMIFDEEVKKLVKGLKDYVSNPKNDFLEDILKKSINFKKNVYTIRLKEQNGSDSNTIINKIKSAGFKNVDDEGIKAVFEKDVNGLLLTLVYDTVSDKLRITYEYMNKGESVVTEGFFNRFKNKKHACTIDEAKEVVKIIKPLLNKYPLFKESIKWMSDSEIKKSILDLDNDISSCVIAEWDFSKLKNKNDINTREFGNQNGDWFDECNVILKSKGFSIDSDGDWDEAVIYAISMNKITSESVLIESVNYDKYIEILNERHDEVLKQIKLANIPSGRRAEAKLILDDNFQKANRFFLKMQSDKGLFTKFVRFLDRKGAISKSKIANLFDDYLLLTDEEIFDIRRKEAEINKINAEAYDTRRRSAVQMEAIMTAGSVAKTAIAAKTATTLMDESGKDIDNDIQSAVNILNKKGYKTVASCSGHTKSRIKEDVYRDGVYNNKLYTTARIVFADDFKLDPPKGWKVKNFDGKIGIYPVTPSYSYSKGMPDDAFDKWKSEYMAELKMWANGLGEKPGPEETKTESMDDFMTNIFGESFKDTIGNAVKKPKKIENDNKDWGRNDIKTNITFNGCNIHINKTSIKNDQMEKEILDTMKNDVKILNSGYNKIIDDIVTKEKNLANNHGADGYITSKSDFNTKLKINTVRYTFNGKNDSTFELFIYGKSNNDILGGHCLVIEVEILDNKLVSNRYSIEG